MSNKEVQDGYAWLKTTGDALAEHIEGMNPNNINSFYENVATLKHDFYKVTEEAFKTVKQSSAFSQRNWMEAKRHEDVLIDKFFKDVLAETSESPDAIKHRFNTMKPNPSGLVRLKAGQDFIAMPGLKL